MLTQKQHELLLFLEEKISRSGITPSFEEMKNKVGLKSKSGIHRLISALEDHGKMYGLSDSKNFLPDRWLEDGDQLELDGINFDVYHCPGHTPGHVIFHNKEAKFAIVGDVLFQGSIGRTDFPRGNHEDLMTKSSIYKNFYNKQIKT